ncbi:MAG: hypothetical protein HKO57_03190, partial [Akkermansiaceae bacterium]|nr:hypothetical protein [Akkermansiaceae bacterium]
FDLHEDDADRLIQVGGGDLLWQKERLLNIGIAALPRTCRNVAWLDCDIVFEDDEWPGQVDALLERCRVVQLFSRCRHLQRDSAITPSSEQSVVREVAGFTAKKARGEIPHETFRVQGESQRLAYSPGLAWAARRDLLQDCGFYDGLVMGGGDKAMAAAAYGYIDETAAAYKMTAPHARHYRAWAEPFFDRIRGKVGWLDGSILHLWHGDLQKRRYPGRYNGFDAFEFDPYTDVALHSDGSWRWSSSKPEMHEFIARYLASRNEDGE